MKEGDCSLTLYISHSFSPASRIILIESLEDFNRQSDSIKGFSPASRIILIESHIYLDSLILAMFQSRKQDYFN